MRKNQVSIFVERFGKYVPKDYPADVQRIHVYCDDGASVYAALSKAYACVINELNEYEHIGARCDVSTNEFSYVDYRKMHGTIPIVKREYDQDLLFEYYSSSKVLHEDFLWAYEHRAEILDVISQCESEKDFAPCLKEKFGLNDVQVRKISQIRMDMLTKERYEKTKADLERIKETEKRCGEPWNTQDMMISIRRWIRECKEEIEIIEAFLKAADNYQYIVEIIKDTDNNREYCDRMEKEYGFSYNQSTSLRFCCANDFSKSAIEKKKQKLEELRGRLAGYEKELEEYEHK